MLLFAEETINNDKDDKNNCITEPKNNKNSEEKINKSKIIKSSKIKDIEEESEYRKIRELKQIATFSNIANNILEQFKHNKLHHATMLTGNYGIGKATFAYWLVAQLILSTCTDDNEKNMHLEMLKKNIHPDVYFLSLPEGENEIKMEIIRKFLDNWVCLKATYGNKFIIIDDINSINTNGLNALLKTLEEPPSNTYFLIINHKISVLLETIYSRCNEIKLSFFRKDCLKILQQQHEDMAFEDIEFYTDMSGNSVNFANILISLNIIDFLKNNANKSIQDLINNIYKMIDANSKDLSRVLKISLLEKVIIYLLNKNIKPFKAENINDVKNTLVNNNNIIQQFVDIKKFELPVRFV